MDQMDQRKTSSSREGMVKSGKRTELILDPLKLLLTDVVQTNQHVLN